MLWRKTKYYFQKIKIVIKLKLLYYSTKKSYNLLPPIHHSDPNTILFMRQLCSRTEKICTENQGPRWWNVKPNAVFVSTINNPVSESNPFSTNFLSILFTLCFMPVGRVLGKLILLSSLKTFERTLLGMMWKVRMFITSFFWARIRLNGLNGLWKVN